MDFKPDRVYIVLEYLRLGGKVKINGRTYVWLNEYVTHETDTEKWVIDGLAIETRSYGPGEDWTDPNAGSLFYMGRRDMTLFNFIELVNNISREDFLSIYWDLKLLQKATNSNHG